MVRRFGLLATLCLALAVLAVPAAAWDEPTPPEQPFSGPGGLVYPFDTVLASRHGDRPTGYWLFQPANGAETRTPPAEPVPLVIFVHGFSAVDPDVYRGWIDHIVRRGAVVVYPDYQTLNPFALRPEEYLANTLTAVRDALDVLNMPGVTTVDTSRVAVVGHSVGGVLAPSYAAVAEAAGLPVPKAVMAVEPGGCEGCGGGGPDRFALAFADLSQIDPATKLIVLVGADDDAVGDGGAKQAWAGTAQMPNENRDYVIVESDEHGRPKLRADHFMPQTGSLGGEEDALDYYGLWKTFDLLLACAFDGDCSGMNGSLAQRDMGEWSDGTPVADLIVTDTP